MHGKANVHKPLFVGKPQGNIQIFCCIKHRDDIPIAGLCK